MPTQNNTLFNFQLHLKFFKVVALALSVFSLLSCIKNEKLSVYFCPYQLNADRCNVGCNLEKDMQTSFVVSKEERSVLQIMYWDGNQSSSITHKNCTVFNNLNWDCSESKQFKYSTEKNETKMVNGVFAMYSEVRNSSDSSIRNTDEKGICAK